MPYPANLKTAIAVEDIVTNQGAVPATIAIMNGKICVGMNKTELKELAETRGTYKTSRRDLPYVLSKRLTGGTTVAGTMVIAHQAGIPVFVTGGIGGVHRGSEKSMDVSADLTELSRTPLTVVSGGGEIYLRHREDIGIFVSLWDNGEFAVLWSRLKGLGMNVLVFTPSRDIMVHALGSADSHPAQCCGLGPPTSTHLFFFFLECRHHLNPSCLWDEGARDPLNGFYVIKEP
ncbi:pseudouridine-5'-phosphate glycosidase-like [Tachypleus tridentatus]|uniref:pseudouridine-5'-phosphate glycosidase-like n=1 Tax=Tachypleus tridentatus TaxID=6853 RepID=UPI003FD3320D